MSELPPESIILKPKKYLKPPEHPGLIQHGPETRLLKLTLAHNRSPDTRKNATASSQRSISLKQWRSINANNYRAIATMISSPPMAVETNMEEALLPNASTECIEYRV
ncbi:uncharacterized protein N7503_010733 [Penicillium pulvis]|uniref:uncharacterized protein n=1 Tax=Penicillium pulvis TaxID=1562058 RepID=UPI0025480835|nr:uncharacterized protein N7503_010733 [Penicillium pulvis]KAJ5785521.1 hypothetical protein N7503_010733 [Penicillium pulvis]